MLCVQSLARAMVELLAYLSCAGELKRAKSAPHVGSIALQLEQGIGNGSLGL